MTIGIPQDLNAAIAQSINATQAALADGRQRIQVEFGLPELKVAPIALQFVMAWDDWGDRLKVFFPDAGAAALARRDWGAVACQINDVGSERSPLTGKVKPEDELFLFVEPSDVEVNRVEKLCQDIGDRPVIFLNPRLENVAVIGIGYAGRQLRERFLSTLETLYCLQPIESGAIFRAYPQPWQVWLAPDTEEGDYCLAAEVPQRPTGEALENILGQTSPSPPSRPGPLTRLQQFLNALSH